MNSRLVTSWCLNFAQFRTDSYDVYFDERYLKLYETSNEDAVCFIYEEDSNIFLFPFLRRKFQYRDTTFYDFETAYGYGGPISNNNNSEFFEKGLLALKEYCQSNNYVAGFIRFHPLFNNYEKFDSVGTLIFDRYTIAIDLSLSDNEIWMDEIHTKNRNVIKKANKLGLEFIIDKEYKYLNDFIRLYNSTMSKLNADSFYYFNEQYYSKFVNIISDSFLGVVKYNDIVISAAIFFYSNENGHYHLSGSDVDYLKLCPNNFMLYEASKVLKKMGIKKFHLGGGVNSDENNSLFQFKSKFSRSRFQFYIGKTIFNQKIYDELCIDWIENNPEKYNDYKHFLLKYKY